MQGTLLYNPKCLKCRMLVRIVKVFNIRQHIKFRAMRKDEIEFFGAPVIIPQNGMLIIGLRPVAKYVLRHLFF